jgi:hypothetical protein
VQAVLRRRRDHLTRAPQLTLSPLRPLRESRHLATACRPQRSQRRLGVTSAPQAAERSPRRVRARGQRARQLHSQDHARETALSRWQRLQPRCCCSAPLQPAGLVPPRHDRKQPRRERRQKRPLQPHDGQPLDRAATRYCSQASVADWRQKEAGACQAEFLPSADFVRSAPLLFEGALLLRSGLWRLQRHQRHLQRGQQEQRSLLPPLAEQPVRERCPVEPPQSLG